MARLPTRHSTLMRYYKWRVSQVSRFARSSSAACKTEPRRADVCCVRLLKVRKRLIVSWSTGSWRFSTSATCIAIRMRLATTTGHERCGRIPITFGIWCSGFSIQPSIAHGSEHHNRRKIHSTFHPPLQVAGLHAFGSHPTDCPRNGRCCNHFNRKHSSGWNNRVLAMSIMTFLLPPALLRKPQTGTAVRDRLCNCKSCLSLKRGEYHEPHQDLLCRHRSAIFCLSFFHSAEPRAIK